MNQQITSFEILFPFLNENGLYVAEDLHSSYWYNYGGGYKKASSFIKYSKKIIDKIHAWYSESDRLKPDYYTKNIYGLHFYDSILMIDKRKIIPPKVEMSGEYVFVPGVFNESFASSKKKSLSGKFLHRIKFKLYKWRYG